MGTGLEARLSLPGSDIARHDHRHDNTNNVCHRTFLAPFGLLLCSNQCQVLVIFMYTSRIVIHARQRAETEMRAEESGRESVSQRSRERRGRSSSAISFVNKSSSLPSLIVRATFDSLSRARDQPRHGPNATSMTGGKMEGRGANFLRVRGKYEHHENPFRVDSKFNLILIQSKILPICPLSSFGSARPDPGEAGNLLLGSPLLLRGPLPVDPPLHFLLSSLDIHVTTSLRPK